MLVLVVSQAAALLVVVLCVWLPFRWWYVTTDDQSLLLVIPYFTAIVFTLCLFRCHCGALQFHSPRSEPAASPIGNPDILPEVSSGQEIAEPEVFEDSLHSSWTQGEIITKTF